MTIRWVCGVRAVREEKRTLQRFQKYLCKKVCRSYFSLLNGSRATSIDGYLVIPRVTDQYICDCNYASATFCGLP